MGAEVGERRHCLCVAAGELGSQRRSARQQRPRLRSRHPLALVHAHALFGLQCHVVGLSGDHHRHGGGQAVAGGKPRIRPLVEQYLMGQRLQGVSDEDRLADPEQRPHRRAMPPLLVAVDDVVVEEREVVHQLDGDGSRNTNLCGSAHSLGREERQGRTHTLSGAGGRCPVGLHVPEVVLGGAAQVRVQRRQSGDERRIDEPLGSLQDVGRDGDALHHAGTSSVVRLCQSAGASQRAPKSLEIALAAATPLRTAPSIVAGQPVSVHAPAR